MNRTMALALTLGAGLVASCYEMNGARVQVRTPLTELDCVETADSVFEREGFVAAPNFRGANRLYTPRASATQALALDWGIAVAIEGGPGRDRQGPCSFELEALSVDEGCGINCQLTPHPGFNDVTRKMAGLLDAAFSGPAGRAKAPPK